MPLPTAILYGLLVGATGTKYNGLTLGQNIGAATSDTADVSIKTVITLWQNEQVNYNYANNTCQTGKVCGHYTQMVWKNTQYIGCGVSNAGNKIFGPGYPTNWFFGVIIIHRGIM